MRTPHNRKPIYNPVNHAERVISMPNGKWLMQEYKSTITIDPSTGQRWLGAAIWQSDHRPTTFTIAVSQFHMTAHERAKYEAQHV